ncbi:MAG: carboxypeptidase-like regulatory domain-containing protein, partial [Saprospiraceae bacterium]
FHIYPGKNGEIDNYLNQIYWISKISNKPWIIGETGYAASELNSGKYIDGNLDDQKLFFQKSYQYCLDCWGQGYSWWQFHDVAWSSDYGMLDSFHQIKPFAQIAKNLLNYKADYSKCKAPSSYFNIPEKFNDSYSGKIINEMSEPIPNAIIICSTLSGKKTYTYSKEDGSFSVYSTSPISSIKVTAPGYKTRKRNLFYANSKIKLKKEILNESEFLLKSKNDDMEYCKICVERKLEKEIIQCKNDKKCISQCTNTYKVEMDKCKNKMLKSKT